MRERRLCRCLGSCRVALGRSVCTAEPVPPDLRGALAGSQRFQSLVLRELRLSRCRCWVAAALAERLHLQQFYYPWQVLPWSAIQAPHRRQIAIRVSLSWLLGCGLRSLARPLKFVTGAFVCNFCSPVPPGLDSSGGALRPGSMLCTSEPVPPPRLGSALLSGDVF